MSQSKTRRPADTISWFCLLAIVALVPIAVTNFAVLGGSPVTYDQFDLIKSVLFTSLAAAGISAWLGARIVSGGSVRITRTDWLVLAVVAWFAVSTATSLHWPTSLVGKYRRYEGLVTVASYAVAYFLAVQYVDRFARLRTLAWALVSGSVVVAGYGLLQYMGIDKAVWTDLPFERFRSFSTFGNPDLLAGYLVISAPVALGLALSATTSRGRWFAWAATLLNAVVLVTAFTRGAWIAGVVALAVIVFTMVRSRTALRTEDLAALAAGVMAVAFVVIRSLSNPSAVMNVARRVTSIFEFGSGSALTRFQIWDSAWRATLARPIVGFGPDTFRLIFPQYKPAAYAKAAGYLSVADNAHNYPLQLAATVGLVGAALYLGCVGHALWRTRTSIGGGAAGDSRRILPAALWAACIGYMVHLLFGISAVGSSALFWVLLGAVVAPGARSIELPQNPAVLRVLAPTILAAFALGVTGWGTARLVADNHHLKARIAEQTGSSSAPLEAAKAAALFPFTDVYRGEVGLAYQQQLEAMATAGDWRSEQYRDVFEAGERTSLEAMRFSPYEVDNYIFLASMYVKAAATIDPVYYSNSMSMSRKVLEFAPYSANAHLQLARANMGLGRYDEAEAELKQALDLDPGYVTAWLVRVQVAQRTGDQALYEKSLAEARRLDPTNENLSLFADPKAGRVTEPSTSTQGAIPSAH